MSNSPPPPSITNDSLNTFTLLTFSEPIESKYFNDLYVNITTNVTGYETDGYNREYLLRQIKAAKFQEEIHYLSALNVVEHYGGTPVSLCGEYIFPVQTLKEAVAFAQAFSILTIGILQDAILHFAKNGDAPFTQTLAAVLANEAEQAAYYGFLGGDLPNDVPFATPAAQDFAFTALKSLVNVSTCSNLDVVDLQTFDALVVVTNVTATSQPVTFEVFTSSLNGNVSDFTISYINQQNIPVTQPIYDIQPNGNTTTFSAYFPYAENLMNGLTIAALTRGSNFTDFQAVADKTVAGPGLIIL